MYHAPSKRARKVDSSGTMPCVGGVDVSSPSTTILTTSTIDDPCWGSPGSCSLSHLLSQLDRRKSILYESEDYIVLNKPPDLRMDGEYPATVHKLLMYWYPPKSLIEQCGDESLESIDQNLLGLIARIHKHDNQDPGCLRPCHQLDYATSGVLLIARTKAAANKARLAFEHRQARKQYFAVVCGHLKIASAWPTIPRDTLERTIKELESCYRSTRARRHKDTWNGYQPPHAIFQQWQMQRRRKSCRRNRKLTDEEWDSVWGKVTVDDGTAAQLETMKWKEVKDTQLAHYFERAASSYNMIEKRKMEANRQESEHELPTFFRVEDDAPHVFYVFAPLAQATDTFAMRIHSDQQQYAQGSNLLSASDSDGLDFKPSLTRCQLKEASHSELFEDGQPVSLAYLEPLTGRRHQLRVHMTLLGHSIVGDQTYQARGAIASRADRMCLHSHRLAVPVLYGGKLLNIEAEAPYELIGNNITIKSSI